MGSSKSVISGETEIFLFRAKISLNFSCPELFRLWVQPMQHYSFTTDEELAQMSTRNHCKPKQPLSSPKQIHG